MKTYDLYGTSDLDPADLKRAVEQALGVAFQERDSSYRGGS